MAAMVGVYAPQAVARRVIRGVTNMHARVEGQTPGGESYRALDVELLDWVSATASWGFLTAYDRFVAKLTDEEKSRFYADGDAVSRLYGVQSPLKSDADFFAMLDRLALRFEPHPIVTEFLSIFESSSGGLQLPKSLRRAIARASTKVSILKWQGGYMGPLYRLAATFVESLVSEWLLPLMHLKKHKAGESICELGLFSANRARTMTGEMIYRLNSLLQTTWPSLIMARKSSERNARPLVRQPEFWPITFGMSVFAYLLERMILRSLKKSGAKP